MKHIKFFISVPIIFLVFFSIVPKLCGEAITVEDIGPNRGAPGVLQRQALQNKVDSELKELSESTLEKMDSDRDGVSDAKDLCPDTPSLEAKVSVGESLNMDEIEFRYVIIDGESVIQTTNIPADEGGDQECVLKAEGVGTLNPICVLEGAPEIEIYLYELSPARAHLFIKYAVDETGCSAE